jgi:hypothetical protein
MADYTGTLSAAGDISSSGTFKVLSAVVIASSVPSTGQFSSFSGTLSASTTVISVSVPSTQTKGQLFP